MDQQTAGWLFEFLRAGGLLAGLVLSLGVNVFLYRQYTKTVADLLAEIRSKVDLAESKGAMAEKFAALMQKVSERRGRAAPVQAKVHSLPEKGGSSGGGGRGPQSGGDASDDRGGGEGT